MSKGFLSWFKKNKDKNTTNENNKNDLDEKRNNNIDKHNNQEQITNAIAHDNNENVNKSETTVSDENTVQLSEVETIEKPNTISFFTRLKNSLKKTSENLGLGLVALFKGKKIDDELFEEIETRLLLADVGVETTNQIIHNLTKKAKLHELKDAEALFSHLKTELKEILDKTEIKSHPTKETPQIILMVGVNGVGKTTTIGKLAKQFQSQGSSVMLAAGDTFRAAAVEQLQVWGERNHIPVIAQETGSDSAAVIYNACASAKAKKVDVLIADTAGRLQNKSHLMDELKKIHRVIKKFDNNAPHEVILALDATTGQNAISQTQFFNDTVGITNLIITKLDGTAKGGIIFALANQFKIPISHIGIGEGIDDLRPFDNDTFIDALFETEKEK